MMSFTCNIHTSLKSSKALDTWKEGKVHKYVFKISGKLKLKNYTTFLLNICKKLSNSQFSIVIDSWTSAPCQSRTGLHAL